MVTYIYKYKYAQMVNDGDDGPEGAQGGKGQDGGRRVMLAGNTIYVGNKPAMRYVAVILSGFHDRKLDEVVLRARGSAISAAVDAAEIARNRFMPDLEPSVTIVTDQVEGEDGRKRSVSAMEITLRRSHGAQAVEERAALPLDGGVKCRQPEWAEDGRSRSVPEDESPGETGKQRRIKIEIC